MATWQKKGTRKKDGHLADMRPEAVMQVRA